MQNRKIVFFITSTGWGGLEMNTIKLAILLRNRGWIIHLISTHSSEIVTRHKNDFDGHFILHRVKKYFDFNAARKIGNYLRANGIGLSMCFDNRDIDVLFLAKSFFDRKMKLVYQQHMQIGLNKKDLLHTLRFKSIDHWITPLNWLRDEVKIRTNFPEDRIEVIPIGVHLEKFINGVYDKREARKKMRIDFDGPLVGIIGRISPKKGQDVVIKSLNLLKNKNIHLLIFGSATINDADCQSYDLELRCLAEDLKLKDRIHFVPFQNDTALFYNAIDVFVLASEGETYGMVTIESMLNGIPSIVTKSGGSPELIAHGEFGWLFQPGNSQELADRIEEILQAPQKSDVKAKAAKTMAMGKFDANLETHRIATTIQRLIS